MTRPLEQPLPEPLLRRKLGWASYQSFPVFSWSWLVRRTKLAALGMSAFAVLVGLAAWDTGTGLSEVIGQSVLGLAGGLAMFTGGPLLATLVRTRGLEERRERVLVVAALVVGLFISFAADNAVSEKIAEIHPSEPSRGLPPEALAANLVVLVVIYGLFGGGLAVRRYFVEVNALRALAQERDMKALRERARELDTRLGVLQAQIEPHFLFNALASVRSLVTHDPDAAVEAIDALVAYLRATIPKIREGTVASTVAEQVALCESYLRLMRARMGRLEYTVSVDPDVAELSFPPLVLLTLVENAVKHGIEPKCGPGAIDVRATRRDDALVVEVMDDGVGLSPSSSGGLGLDNVVAQLQARYGEAARFELASRASGGVRSSITLREDAGGHV